jgi:pimeloyl-ACP methyl ester carboxylesterase
LGRDNDRTVRIFVARVSPPGGAPSAEPVVVAGTSFGSVPNYLGIAPLAQRTGREVVIVDPRGVGHSEPSLDCDQVHAAAGDAMEAGTGRQLVEAVRNCHAVVSESGLDPAAFASTAMAHDLDGVRRALGIEKWAVAAYGSSALIVAELMRLHPDQVTAVILDSPLLPGMEPLGGAQERLTGVVRSLLTVCRQDPSCSRRYGEPGLTLEAALDTVTAEPIVLRPHNPDGEVVRLVLDRELLLRALRQITSDGGSSGVTMTLDAVPSILRQVVDRDTFRLTRGLGQALLAQEPFCLGRSTSCLAPRHHISVGAWLTTMCGDLAPFAHRATPRERQLTGVDLCSAWPVDETDPGTSTAVRWDQPTLVAVGRWSTYTPPGAVRAATRLLEDVTWVIDPAGGNNVLPRTRCALEVRDSWLQDAAHAVDTGCMQRERLRWVDG